jgi:anti-sigma factor RsiW
MAMTTDPNVEVEAIEALLPWYAAGTLDADDVRRVEEALARRPELQASLRVIREDRDETIALNESLGAPGRRAWAKVMAAVEAAPRKPGLAARLAALVGLGAQPNPTRLALVGAAAALVILVESTAIVTMLPGAGGPSYRTASESPSATAGAAVLVAFAPEARLDQIGQWLQQRHATVVDGPRGGFYRLRVGDKPLSKAEMSALVAELGTSPLVHAVLPASAP